MEAKSLVASIPKDVMHILSRLSEAGFGVWLVGGVIRDHLLGLTPQDWDLATDAAPQQVTELFPRVVPIGVRHGTVQVRTNRRGVEVTSIPMRGEEGILRDLDRRDFTLNAMALSLSETKLLDPHNGQVDLRNGVLRGVLDPADRFREDPLRTLRAARFCGVYGFRIEERTFEALRNEASGLAGVAGERIREEMCKLLPAQFVVEAFGWMKRGGVLDALLPELLECSGKNCESHLPYDIFEHTLLRVHHCPMRLRVRLAALFHDLDRCRLKEPAEHGEPAPRLHSRPGAVVLAEIMQRWRMSHKEIREVSVLVENRLPALTGEWSDPSLRRLLSRVGVDLLEDLLDLSKADRTSHVNSEAALEELSALRARILDELRHSPPLGLKDLAVDGGDIMRALNLKSSPLVGEILRELHGKVLDNPYLNDRKILMDFLKKEYDGKYL